MIKTANNDKQPQIISCYNRKSALYILENTIETLQCTGNLRYFCCYLYQILFGLPNDLIMDLVCSVLDRYRNMAHHEFVKAASLSDTDEEEDDWFEEEEEEDYLPDKIYYGIVDDKKVIIETPILKEYTGIPCPYKIWQNIKKGHYDSVYCRDELFFIKLHKYSIFFTFESKGRFEDYYLYYHDLLYCHLFREQPESFIGTAIFIIFKVMRMMNSKASDYGYLDYEETKDIFKITTPTKKCFNRMEKYVENKAGLACQNREWQFILQWLKQHQVQSYPEEPKTLLSLIILATFTGDEPHISGIDISRYMAKYIRKEDFKADITNVFPKITIHWIGFYVHNNYYLIESERMSPFSVGEFYYYLLSVFYFYAQKESPLVLALVMMKRYLPLFQKNNPQIKWTEEILTDLDAALKKYERQPGQVILPKTENQLEIYDAYFIKALETILLAKTNQANDLYYLTSCVAVIAQTIICRMLYAWTYENLLDKEQSAENPFTNPFCLFNNEVVLAVGNSEYSVVSESLSSFINTERDAQTYFYQDKYEEKINEIGHFICHRNYFPLEPDVDTVLDFVNTITKKETSKKT